MSIIDDITDGTGIDLGKAVKLPTVSTSIDFTNKTIIVIGSALAVVAWFVFKPFRKRRR